MSNSSIWAIDKTLSRATRLVRVEPGAMAIKGHSISLSTSITEASSTDCLMSYKRHSFGGARGVMVIVVGNGPGDMSSNPGRDWLHFT